MSYEHQNATLTAGTLVYYKALNAADETYALWNGLTEIGDIGTSGSFVEDTTLADTVKTYIPGMKDTSELEFTFYRYNADTAQADLISKAQAGTSVTIKIVWPNNTQAVFDAEGATGTNTWFLDDRHPTLKATYMAAAMEYGLIFGEDPTAITYAPSDLSGTDATSMRTYASNALNGFTNYVDHTAGKVHYKVTIRDQYGMEIEPADPVVVTVSDGGTINDENVFTTNGTNGTFNVNATTGNFTQDATLKVATAETEVVVYPAIELNEQTLNASENFNTIGDEATATLPQAWRIDRQLTAPRTVGRFDLADTQTMYSGGRMVLGTLVPTTPATVLWAASRQESPMQPVASTSMLTCSIPAKRTLRT